MKAAGQTMVRLSIGFVRFLGLTCPMSSVYAPVAVPWSNEYPTPKEMTAVHMQYVIDAFVAATKRAVVAGCTPRPDFSHFALTQRKFFKSIS